MKNMNRKKWTGLIVAGVVAFSLTSYSALASRRHPKRSIDWQSCGEEFPAAECAMVGVPLDYDKPRGRQIDIALARIPATDPHRKIGTLFINPGGPGGSGVDMVLFGWGEYLKEVTGGQFDVVGFDPRGIGASAPIRCFDSQEESDAFFVGYPLFPYKEEQKWPYFVRTNEYAEICLDRDMDITHHMSTADVARDLDLLRQAVGDRQLTYLGFSYGSHIGNTYANLFPGNIRALVIDGVINPELWTPGLQIVADRTAAQKVVNEFSRLCDEAGPDNCAATGPMGAQAIGDALADALREEPFIFPDGSVYAYDTFIADTLSAMYRPEMWGGPDGAAAFVGALADAVLYNDTRAAEVAKEVQLSLKRRFEASHPTRDIYDNGLDAFFGNTCGDIQFPFRYQGIYAMGEFAAQGSKFGPAWWWRSSTCARWPTADDRHVGPWKTRTSNPVLIVGNYFDPATDYAGAVASSKLLENSRLLSYAGWGHCAFSRSECVGNYVVQYLLDGSLPKEGTVCPANPNPFLPNMLRSMDRGTPRETLPAIGRPLLPGSFR
ncbi:MAG: alpha/beta fold hydrolase [Deltaproteobacteria bacterium]|nr:alpha/beta fold hydrolase [Deltaproteobacteria bacterium]